MLLNKAKNLILNFDYDSAITLLNSIEHDFDDMLDRFEGLVLLAFANRRARNYSLMPMLSKKVRDSLDEVILKTEEIAKLIENFVKFSRNELDADALDESINSLTENQKAKIPALIYTKFIPVIVRDGFNTDPILLDKLDPYFIKFQGKLFYSELILLTAWNYLYRTENQLALQYVEKYSKLAEEIKDKHGPVITPVTKSSIYANMGNSKNAIKFSKIYLEKAKEMENINSIWHATFAVALHYAMSTDLINAAKFNNECIKLEQHPEFTNHSTVPTRKLVETRLHWKKGDVDLALKMQLELLEFQRKANPYSLAITLSLLGDSYYQKGDLNKAYTYYKESLEVRENFKASTQVAENYFQLILICIEQDNRKEALDYLSKLESLNKKTEEIAVTQILKLSHALILKQETNKENKEKAKSLLLELINQEAPYYQTADRAYLYLCDNLLEEIKLTNNLQLLPELNELLQKLTKRALEQESYLLLIETYFLQSKMFLLELKIEESLDMVEKAQNLAEEKGITRLEILLSNEYDVLVEQLDSWETLTRTLPTLEERFEFTHIESLLNKMMRRWITYSDIVQEEESPCYFVILNEEGSIVFSDTFSSYPLEMDKVSILLSKVKNHNATISENTLKPLRFRLEEYSCIASKEANLVFCYIFIGKSYLPLKKYIKFLNSIQNSEVLTELKKCNVNKISISQNIRFQLTKLLEENNIASFS